MAQRSALGNYGAQFLPPYLPQTPNLQNVVPPMFTQGSPYAPYQDLTGGLGIGLPAAPSMGNYAEDYLLKALPLPGGSAIPFAKDIYDTFAGENEAAAAGLKQPPTLEAIIRETNQGRSDSPNDLSRSFSLGQLPPDEFFRSPALSGVGNVDYSRYANMLPGAKRIDRKVAPPTDFSAADAAMAAAKPQYEEGSPWGQVLQGLAAGALRNMDGDLSQVLFAAAMGGLGGLGSGMDVEQERKDLAKAREQQFNERLAGFDLEKAGTQRAEQQQGFDAAYESDVNYQQQEAQRQQQIVSILLQGANQNQENARFNAGLANETKLRNLELARDKWQASQPTVEITQHGLVTTSTDPKTGQRTMTLDNSPWMQRLQAQAMFRQMAALGLGNGNMPGLDFGTGTGEVDGEELGKRLSTYYFMNPMAANQDLGQDFMGQSVAQTKLMAGSDEKLIPQMMGNNIYSFIAPIMADPSHPLHKAVLARMAQMQGMF